MDPIAPWEYQARKDLADRIVSELAKDTPSEARLTLLMRRLNYYQKSISGIKV